MKPLHFYFLGTGSWFFAFGIQSVTFAWLVTMKLNESPDKVGIAQMAFLAPAMLLMLVGGSLADHYGGRRVALAGQLGAFVAPLFLTTMLLADHFSYGAVIAFALIMGCAQAMVTPARDGLLAVVAEGLIQRRVVQASMIQFGIQMLGFLAASLADRTGAAIILMIQAASLLIGAFAYFRLDVPYTPSSSAATGIFSQIRNSIAEGYRTVRASPSMRMVVVQNCAMGTFFMGSYIVTLPLLVRERYDGSSVELSWINAANSLGLMCTIMLLLRFGDLHRQGRALLIAQGIGCFALAGAGLGLGFGTLVGFMFGWGVCGGIAMTMSRTIMQEQSPPDQRGRMMAFFSFSFMGSGPIGALFSGYIVEWVGPPVALMISSVLMFSVVSIVTIASGLWKLEGRPPQEPAPAAPHFQRT